MSTSIKTAVKNFQDRYGDNAPEKTADLLKSGIVVAYAQDAERRGQKQELHSDFWLGLDADEIQTIFGSGTYHFTDEFYGDNVSTRECVIELDRPMMSVLLARLKTQHVPASPSGAGAPRKIDWDQVWTIVVISVHEGGFDETKEAFIEKIQRRLQNDLDLDVSRTQLQKVIGPLWRMLKHGASAKDVFTKPPRKLARRRRKAPKINDLKKAGN
jgi:hypothetical protein